MGNLLAMQATDLLIRQLERELESFLKIAGKVPADKLDWTPGEGTRSALSQMQEVATVISENWGLYETRKMVWNDDAFAAWLENRSQYTTFEAIEAKLKEDIQQLKDFVRTRTPDDLEAEVEMPWPGEFKLCDVIYYACWNMAYHEGQIATILMLLGIDPMGF